MGGSVAVTLGVRVGRLARVETAVGVTVEFGDGDGTCGVGITVGAGVGCT